MEGVHTTPGEAHSSSSSTILMVGSKQLNANLHPTFQQPANQRHGLWACRKCVVQQCVAAQPPTPLRSPAVPGQAGSAPDLQALPYHIAAPSPLPSIQPQPQPQQQQQQQSKAFTRGGKQDLVAEIEQRSWARQQLVAEHTAEIERRSGERKQLVAQLQELKEQQGLSEEVLQQQQQLLEKM